MPWFCKFHAVDLVDWMNGSDGLRCRISFVVFYWFRKWDEIPSFFFSVFVSSDLPSSTWMFSESIRFGHVWTISSRYARIFFPFNSNFIAPNKVNRSLHRVGGGEGMKQNYEFSSFKLIRHRPGEEEVLGWKLSHVVFCTVS